MRNINLWWWIMGLGVVFMLVPSSTAETDDSTDPLAQFRNPTDWLEMGADLRFREVYGENIDTLNKASAQNYYHYERYRARFWNKYKLSDDLDINARLVWEFRTWDNPARKPQSTDFDEVLFDHFNVTYRNALGLPMTAVIGRQDIALGERWLVFDGTPLDGSRTIFMDAARFTLDWKESDTKLDLIYVDMGAASDRWLKPIEDRDRNLTEEDNRGAIVYLTQKLTDQTKAEAYFMYKNDNTPDSGSSNMPASWASKNELFTLGGALTGDLYENWNYRVEGAYQKGDNQRAFATNSRLNYNFKDSLSNGLHIGYEYASGDDPDTSRNEEFDYLWSQWPRWSELLIYTYTLEGEIANNSNVHRLNVGHSFKPYQNLQVSTDIHFLLADEKTTNANFVSSDKDRGMLYALWFKYTHNKHIKGHLVTEYLTPEGYYGTLDDDALFMRLNIEYTF